MGFDNCSDILHFEIEGGVSLYAFVETSTFATTSFPFSSNPPYARPRHLASYVLGLVSISQYLVGDFPVSCWRLLCISAWVEVDRIWKPLCRKVLTTLLIFIAVFLLSAISLRNRYFLHSSLSLDKRRSTDLMRLRS